MNKKRIIAYVTVVFLLANILVPYICVSAFGKIITVSDKDDLIELAKNCTLDTWSQGKTVNLACDIDMGNNEFYIPTFGGTFKGNGHTISGINISKSGSALGFFRYIQAGGTVSDLKIRGTYVPKGTKSHIGAIAGTNNGVVSGCSTYITVKGDNVIGGIVGNNTQTGQIISCTANGFVEGENSTGGIVGINEGLVIDCVNNACVNTEYEEEKRDAENINADIGALVENYKSFRDENTEKSFLGHSDTGGIAGYNSGVVEGCTNNAKVGYSHVGYNVGGIAGRQSGYIVGCTNIGEILGRKDVGGIAGQTEPNIILTTSQVNMDSVRNEVETLRQMIDNFSTDGNGTRENMDNISRYAKTALDNAEILADNGISFVDDNISEINAQTAILSNTLDKLIPVLEDMENCAEDMTNAVDEIILALDETDVDLFGGETLNNLQNALRSMRKAVLRIERAMTDFDNAIIVNNRTETKTALDNLSEAIKDLIQAKQSIKDSLEGIEEVLESKPESFEELGINAEKIAEYIKGIKDNTDTVISSLQTIKTGIDTIVCNTEIDFDSVKSCAKNIKLSLRDVSDALYYIRVFAEDIDDADYGNKWETLRERLSTAMSSVSYAVEDMGYATDKLGIIITDLANEEPMHFVKLGDEVKNASTDLFASISDISGELDLLRENAHDETDRLASDLSEIGSQLDVVTKLIFDLTEETSLNKENIFYDVSDEEIIGTKQGKVADCRNYGTIEGDRNTGGIAGTMAIEYAKDPEDDIKKPDTLNFTYKTKAILYCCINEGEICGKNDAVGGVVGFADLGTVYGCENYGNINSTGGGYVGGVAGNSKSSIRKCYAKCKVAGDKYSGGVAGKGDTISQSYAIVNVKGDEYLGSICGDCDNVSLLSGNFFTDNGIGGVDGISYFGSAQAVTFDELRNIPDIPDKFISFRVDFKADDEIIETYEIKYGDRTDKIQCPTPPEKDGYFGTWLLPEDEFVKEDIEIVCEYQPYITLLSSDKKNDTGKLAVVLAEGEFTDKATLSVNESEEAPPKDVSDNAVVYDVLLSDTDVEGQDIVKMRFLNENRDKVRVYQLNDGQWTEKEVSDRGKYAVSDIAGASSTVCIDYRQKGFGIWWIFIPLFCAAAVVGIIKFKKR